MAATEVQKNELREKVSKLVGYKFGGDYHKAFEHYDDDVKDGKISRRELAKLLGDAGIVTATDSQEEAPTTLGLHRHRENLEWS
jgi:hypothetical protein